MEMVAVSISRALDEVRGQIEKAAQTAGRPSDSVTLVAVSKFHPAYAVEAALHAGQRVFGENRVQEAAEKFPRLRAQYPDLRLHLIGGLQTNKAREAVRIADVIESLDRPSLSDALAKAADQEGRMPDLLVEVNTGDEPQKFGVPREKADAFIRMTRERFGEKLCGLMCIPPAGEDPVPHFRFLRSLADEHDLPVRSMGMSADYPQAIAEGATLVRVGTAIFGERPAGVAGD
ncbi:YggS family pyridoxal phosphate-dependent enzyme [Acetobacter sp.]|jgi:pyridoxal phosphate enzyme (YggS family)|uniref:YggS family pyridoxal phosphate-dependent enzyme n=1 Tax=Acetobacter sp. TaxID=440 RepID=UPI0025BC7EFA|nr:YggS family pyridoxal phosphate-dependent enzyme [Acetobacter sp.]MCH4089891.1 YggS family pyridoxal phosphate-dependent enzyme [Acetobacter sp.]MCI1298587.1 YggS family pyridoxal phosphate-dependent enzyme [Acetobacter sp.]MCI1315152.1 YggS family pyridoxal phosphate-dependent enzyme [Acetobacter sp.]